MDIVNPLDGLEIGSCTPVSVGKPWGKSVIRGKVTRTVVQPTKWASMQGQSDYAYTKQMNQGSSGIAGSYGVSGISKVSSALSAYVGNSSAQSGKSLKVNYQIMVRGGVEYVNFEDLTPSLLIAALAEGARSAISKALDAYTNLNISLEKLDLAQPKLFAVIREPDSHKDEYDLYLRWLEAVDNFRRYYGDGMVVQVAWGGIGIVSMEISNKSGESAWKYGGEANFSYAAPGASVSVGAAYDGSRSNGDANVTVDCKQFSSGSPVQAQTDEWFKAVSGHSFKELADVKVLDKAPDMTTKAAVQKPPEFERPKSDEKLADKIGQIKNLDGLKLYAQAAAYDKAKKANKNLTLEQFLQDAAKKADVEPVEELRGAVEEGEFMDVPDLFANDHFALRANASNLVGTAEPVTKTLASGPFDGYTPIGVWIANWDHLFPWLATGFLNSISDTEEVQPMLAYRVLLQDFLTLAKLYYIADSCKFVEFVEMDATAGVSFDQIADSFSQASSKLQSALIEERRKAGPVPGAYEKAMKAAIAPLSANARIIYKTWCENGFLRNCELGLGVMGGNAAQDDCTRHMFVKPTAGAHNMSPHVNDMGKSFADGFSISGGSTWRFTGMTSPSTTVSGSGDVRMYLAERKPCDFDPARKNYSAFAKFYKVLPLIVPKGGVGRIYAFGPGNNILSSWPDDYEANRLLTGQLTTGAAKLSQSFLFSCFGRDYGQSPDSPRLVFMGGMSTMHFEPIEFTPNRKEKILENTDRGIKLYPIPFSAAEGVANWQGQAFSTSVASLTDLKSALQQMEKDLKISNSWSFSSDAWPDGWGPSDYYHDTAIAKQYMGLLEEKEYTAG